MNNLEEEINKLSLRNEQQDSINQDFDILLCSIMYNENSATYYEQLMTCKSLNDYEQITLKKINAYANKINRLPSFDYCIVQNLIRPISKSSLYTSSILKDKFDVFLKEREQRHSYELLHDLANTVKDRGLPKNAESIVNEALTQTKNIYYTTGVAEFKENYLNKEFAYGFRTGVDLIDGMTGGLQLGTLNTVLGFAGSGKTTWAVNIGYLAAAEEHNVAYISLEIGKYYLLCDLLSRHSNELKFSKKIEHRHLKQKTLNKEEQQYLFENIYPHYAETVGKHFYIIDESDIVDYSPNSFYTMLEEINTRFEKETGKGIEMIFVDHIQLLKASNSLATKDTKEIINLFVSFFRKQAVSFLNTKRPVCVVILSQANREGWKNANKPKEGTERGKGKWRTTNDIKGKYQLTALAEANELERSSNIVLSIFTNEALMQCNDARVMILKSRDGSLMEEPATTFIDPKYYIIGDVVGAVFQESSTFDLNEVLGEPATSYPTLEEALTPDIPDVSKMTSEDIMNM